MVKYGTLLGDLTWFNQPYFGDIIYDIISIQCLVHLLYFSMAAAQEIPELERYRSLWT